MIIAIIRNKFYLIMRPKTLTSIQRLRFNINFVKENSIWRRYTKALKSYLVYYKKSIFQDFYFDIDFVASV